MDNFKISIATFGIWFILALYEKNFNINDTSLFVIVKDIIIVITNHDP